MQSIRKVLCKLAEAHGIDGSLHLHSLQLNWEQLVGTTISAHTYPDVIKKKELTIIVDTPQWIHHLSFYREDILSKLKPHHVDSIRFRIGKIDKKIEQDEKKEKSKLTDDDICYVEKTLENIRDEELKERFRRLITHGLTLGKKKNLF